MNAAIRTSIRQALAQARDQMLARTDEAGLEAALLLAHVLRRPRAYLHAHPDQILADAELRAFRALLRRRLSGEPLAYLLGRREFFGLDFVVDRRVLIPRPETELVVERALALTKGTAPQGGPWLVADIGTGSGAIAVSLAMHGPGLRVYALDVSPEALSLAAAENVSLHQVADRVIPLAGDLLRPLPERVHVVVANLPYLSDARWEALAPEVAEGEPRLALYGGPDGLDLYRRLLAQAPAYLLPGGSLLLEIDPEQADPLAQLASTVFGPSAVTVFWPDLSGQTRVFEVRLP